MKKKNKDEPPLLLAIIWIFLILFVVLAGRTYEDSKRPILSPLPARGIQGEGNQESVEDVRIKTLDQFFESYNSPLVGLGADFVRVSDNWDMDYRLLPAISGCESSFGKRACGFNPFGWNKCGTGFTSFEMAIEKVAKKISTLSYYRSWQKEKGKIEKLAYIYDGSSPEEWIVCVKGFMEEIDKYYISKKT